MTNRTIFGAAIAGSGAVALVGRPLTPVVIGIALTAAVAVAARKLSPPGITEAVTAAVSGPFYRWKFRRTWPQLARATGLSRHDLPRILSIDVDWPTLIARIEPATGQAVGDFEEASGVIKLALGAAEVGVSLTGRREISLSVTLGDVLSNPFPAATPGKDPHLPDQVVMGLRADGSSWELPLGPHTLIAGMSGSGKGSIFWSLAFALAPAVHAGLVRLHGIDLKGGMELLMGGELFTTRSTSELEAVERLEHLVEEMRQRSRLYAGRQRAHVATLDQPLEVVLIDELAALTAYSADRNLERRADIALSLLCSQGRAPGFMVVACLQDPRKEVIPTRGLFTQVIGLRLKDVSESIMVLGEGAVAGGGECHRIRRDMPGTAYVLPEDGGHPVLVRAGYVSDDAIRKVATEFCAFPARGTDQSLEAS